VYRAPAIEGKYADFQPFEASVKMPRAISDGSVAARRA
jgi:hypothetical protein